MDVESGHQPLSTSDKQLWMVGNGEVYNHEYVRARLHHDTDYATKSDNEVALHLVREKGPLQLTELEGMFAFLIAGEDGYFMAARDPVGIKPLYYAEYEGVMRFASEMHSFEPDWRPYVQVFPPGHFWTARTASSASPLPCRASTPPAAAAPSRPTRTTRRRATS